MRRFQLYLMASAAIATGGITGGVARAAEDLPADQPNDSTQLEQITVTATKRVERLQDVPVAVTALTSDTLERNNVREIGDLPGRAQCLRALAAADRARGDIEAARVKLTEALQIVRQPKPTTMERLVSTDLQRLDEPLDKATADA